MSTNRILASLRHPKIAHLDDEAINQLIDDYYNGTKLKELLTKNNINYRSSNITKLFPPIVIENKECIYCKVPLWKDFQSKTSLKYTLEQNNAYCPNCGHIDRKNCNCSNCKKTFENSWIESKRALQEKIYKYFDLYQYEPVEPSKLNLMERVYLGTLIRTGLSEDKKYLKIQNFPNSPIAPSTELLNEMINLLSKNKILVIHPDSPPQAFLNQQDLKNSDFDLNRIIYHVNIWDFKSNEVLQFLMFPSIDIVQEKNQIIEIWNKIAIEECMVYLQYSLNYVDLPYTIGEKARIIINDLLKKFSVSQIFGLINRCLGYTTREFQAGKLTRANAGLYLLGALQNQGERAIIKNWELTKYFRPRDLPESQLAQFFFNRILTLGDAGFNSVLSL